MAMVRNFTGSQTLPMYLCLFCALDRVWHGSHCWKTVLCRLGCYATWTVRTSGWTEKANDNMCGTHSHQRGARLALLKTSLLSLVSNGGDFFFKSIIKPLEMQRTDALAFAYIDSAVAMIAIFQVVARTQLKLLRYSFRSPAPASSTPSHIAQLSI